MSTGMTIRLFFWISFGMSMKKHISSVVLGWISID
ncbi:uncharacterized protein METZ01_LOCUS383586, partial [marine metagenome]